MSYARIRQEKYDDYTTQLHAPEHQLRSEGLVSVPTPLLVWNYSSDSDEPSYIPDYPKTKINPPSFDPMNRNNPAHPLHPQHDQYLRELNNASGAVVETNAQPPRQPKIDERVAARQEVLNNPDLLRRALQLTERKEELYRQRQEDHNLRKLMMRRYLEGAFAPRYGNSGRRGLIGIRSGPGTSARRSQRPMGADDWGNYDDEDDDGFGIDLIAYTFDRLNGRKATTCLYILSFVVLLAGLIVTATFFSLSDTAYSFPKLYYTSAVVGALTIIAAFVGALGTWMNHVDVLYGFAALIASLGTVDLILALMGLLEKDSEIVAALTARHSGDVSVPLIDLCVNNARVMSLTVFVAVLLLYFTCFVLYRLRHVLLTDSNPISHDEGVDLPNLRSTHPQQNQRNVSHAGTKMPMQNQLRSNQMQSPNHVGAVSQVNASQSNQAHPREIELQALQVMQQQHEIRITMPTNQITL